jgi:hypothetical protein
VGSESSVMYVCSPRQQLGLPVLLHEPAHNSLGFLHDVK